MQLQRVVVAVPLIFLSSDILDSARQMLSLGHPAQQQPQRGQRGRNCSSELYYLWPGFPHKNVGAGDGAAVSSPSFLLPLVPESMKQPHREGVGELVLQMCHFQPFMPKVRDLYVWAPPHAALLT